MRKGDLTQDVADEVNRRVEQVHTSKNDLSADQFQQYWGPRASAAEERVKDVLQDERATADDHLLALADAVMVKALGNRGAQPWIEGIIEQQPQLWQMAYTAAETVQGTAASVAVAAHHTRYSDQNPLVEVTEASRAVGREFRRGDPAATVRGLFSAGDAPPPEGVPGAAVGGLRR